MKYLMLVSFLLSLNLYAECISTPADSETGVPTNAGINKLVEQNCDATNASHREVILNQKIISGEIISSDSMNLKIKAIDEAIKALSGSTSNGITFSGDTTGYNIVSSTEISGTSGGFIYANESCTGDCYIEFEIVSLAGGNYPQIGLSSSSEYPFSQALAFDDAGNVLVTSGGGYDVINITTYVVGDKFKVSIEGSSVSYYKNNDITPFYTKNSISGASPYKPMLYFTPSLHVKNINFVDLP